MNCALILGGGSERNKAWVDGCFAAYNQYFDQTHYVYYDHWETEATELDFDIEKRKVTRIVNESPDAKWYIFAKSIGSIFTVTLVLDGVVAPNQCVLFGMPFNVVIDSVFGGDMTPLQQYTVPTLALHNQSDPTAEYERTKQIIDEYMPTTSLVTLPGTDHTYLDFEEYTSIESFSSILR